MKPPPRVRSIVVLVSALVVILTFISLGEEHGYLQSQMKVVPTTVGETAEALRESLSNESSSLASVSSMAPIEAVNLTTSQSFGRTVGQAADSVQQTPTVVPKTADTKNHEGALSEGTQPTENSLVETKRRPEQSGTHSGSLLAQAIRETTRVLYKNSPDLDRWLTAPPPKIYVYDTLPNNWTNISLISECIEEKFLGYTGSNQPKGSWGNCFWEPKVCDEIHKPKGKLKRKTFMNYRANYNNDVAYQRWFQGYEFQTRNASEADFFVVPYPHWSHCICHKDLSVHHTRCKHGYEEVEQYVLSNLEHYPANKERHLFLYGVDHDMVRINMREHLNSSMTISLGASCENRMGQLCGHFVTPYLDTSSVYQPDVLQALPRAWWTERNRTYSVGAAFSTVPGFVARVEFIKNQSIHLGDEIGGLPIRALDLLDSRRQMIQSGVRAIYNESVFCPIMPGDGCPQKRFFDVILNGCIPVVPSFTPSDEKGYPTFWAGKGKCSIRRTYPWSQGTFFGDDRAGIDYQSLVVQYDGSCGMPCMKPALEKIMRNSTELKRLRTNLQDFAKLVAFGIGDSMYTRTDSFTAMLVAIRHYLFHLQKSGGIITDI